MIVNINIDYNIDYKYRKKKERSITLSANTFLTIINLSHNMFSGSAIKKIEKNHDKNFVQLYFKAGRTIKDNSFLNAEIRATVNSYYCYTKLGLREKLNNKNISTSELSRQLKQAGVTKNEYLKNQKFYYSNL